MLLSEQSELLLLHE